MLNILCRHITNRHKVDTVTWMDLQQFYDVYAYKEKPFHEEKPFEVLLWKNFNMEAFKRNTRTNPSIKVIRKFKKYDNQFSKKQVKMMYQYKIKI